VQGYIVGLFMYLEGIKLRRTLEMTVSCRMLEIILQIGIRFGVCVRG
jgi:hypothetical protein